MKATGFTLLAFVLATFIYTATAQPLKVEITGIRNNKGALLISLYKSPEEFNTNQPFQTIRLSKCEIKSGSTLLILPLSPCTCGIAVLDDENDSGKMEKNIFGFPKEGFGFSNLKIERPRRPRFDEFKFTHNLQNKPVTVAMWYP